MAVNRHYDTFDEELGAFVLWSIAPNRRGIRCSVLIVDKTPGGDGAERVGGFFDPCYGAQFDFAGRVLLSPANYSAPLKRVRYERVNGDVYQITNPDYLMRAWR